MTPRFPAALIALLARGGLGQHGLPDANATEVPKLPAVTGKDLNGEPWKAPADVHVLVVAREGTILAREKGRHTEAAPARILKVLHGE
jgi:hypothetical protein